MSSPGNNSKRRSLLNQLSVEEQALNIIAKEADNREEKSSAILAEARKIRCSEREKNRKDDETDYDEEDICSDAPSKHAISSPRPTPQSRPVLEQSVSKRVFGQTSGSNPKVKAIGRTLRRTAKDGFVDSQEKYRKLMMANAQLDNEKQALAYQLELMKDVLGDKTEEYLELKSRLHKITQERDRMSRDLKEVEAKCHRLKVDILQRDHLIKSSGLSLVTVDGSTSSAPPPCDLQEATSGSNMAAAVLTSEHLEMLADFEGSLGERLKQLFDVNISTAEENKRLQKEIESLKSNQLLNANQAASQLMTSSLDETQKQYTETKLKLKRAEQEITALQGTVTRLETQMLRYKTSAETLEKAEEELKGEKRKLQIELREAKSKIEELEAKINIYLKRIEKLKSKNAVENSS